MGKRNRAAPIGVYDSGVGGLSVLGALQARLPAESFYYLADSVNCPYGDRDAAEIQRLALGVGRHLLEVGCKLIVVACNTISSTSLTVMREALDGLPIVGMVPAVKPAIETTHTGVVGVLATQATVRGALYLDVLRRYAQNTRVISQACPGLVELIEAGKVDASETEALLRRSVEPMVDAGADVIVLGCSHYPFIRPLLERIVGRDVRIIEPSDAIARQTLRILDREGLLCDATSVPGVTRFATSGDTQAFDASVFRLVGLWPGAEALVWDDGRLCLPRTSSVL